MNMISTEQGQKEFYEPTSLDDAEKALGNGKAISKQWMDRIEQKNAPLTSAMGAGMTPSQSLLNNTLGTMQ